MKMYVYITNYLIAQTKYSITRFQVVRKNKQIRFLTNLYITILHMDTNKFSQKYNKIEIGYGKYLKLLKKHLQNI